MPTKIAIIGAGLSGLTTAVHLKDHAEIEVFEKSRGVGGRMSTRRAENYAFDHGAQFFTAKSDSFKRFMSPMIEAHAIEPWQARFTEIEHRKITLQRQWNEIYPHYVGVPAMNAIPKYLSRDLKIQLNTRIKVITRHQEKWQLKDDHHNVLGEYDWVITAIPPQQALAVLPNTLSCYSMISAFKMQACFALMLGFEQDINLKFDAARIHDDTISWLSVNNTKPGRDSPHSLLIQSTNQWANMHIDADQTWVMNTLCDKACEITGVNIDKADHKTLHRWRYANIGKQHGQTHFLEPKQCIAVCGDWFIQGRVEAAFQSGFKTAKQIISILRKKDDQ